MKKFLMGLALLGVVASQSVADDQEIYKKYNFVLDFMNDAVVHFSVYDLNGTKVRDSTSFAPNLEFESLNEARKADKIVNKVCKGKRIYASNSYDFICGDEDKKYEYVQLLIDAGIKISVPR